MTDAAPVPHGQGELVLVVDDESVLRNITQRVLEKFGYRVVLACDGAEAVEIHAELRGTIRLVLTDMLMPVMDGPATIAALLASEPTLPIIATSGLGARSTAEQVAHGQVRAVLDKPFTADGLLRTVRKVLDAAS